MIVDIILRPYNNIMSSEAMKLRWVLATRYNDGVYYNHNNNNNDILIGFDR